MAMLNGSGKTVEMALTAHAIPHLMGYLADKSGRHCDRPLLAEGLMDTAIELGFCGVDVGIPYTDPAALDQFGEALRSRGLRLVAELDILSRHDPDDVRRCIDAASKLGARVLRVMISGILCGDRRSLGEGGWEALLVETASRLKELLPYAQDRGICLAVENHQDASSDDLLRLHEMSGSSAAYGVTLDAGNPLAVGEDPVEFARKLSHVIGHIHTKDYTIHFAPTGYRLVRCAAGDGVVDFPAILEIVRANGRGVLPGLEIGAQATRTIPILDDGWWQSYGPRRAVDLLPALRVLWKHGRAQDEPYASAWEAGKPSHDVCDDEWRLLRRSAAYFHRIL